MLSYLQMTVHPARV